MPAKDIYHDIVKRALIADGWIITNDPLVLKIGTRDMFIDLGVEQLLAAEKAARKIAVEIKSFLGPSMMTELERAIGQYIVYHDVLKQREPERQLYIAMPQRMLDLMLEEPLGKLLLQNQRLQVVLFDPQQEVIAQWIPN